MVKASKAWWEDDTRSKDGKCAVCLKCRISLRTGNCMYGGPFKGYVKVE